MITTITTRANSVTINGGVVTDNKGFFTFQRRGDITILSHKASGFTAQGKPQDFVCNGETFTTANQLHDWIADNLFYNGGAGGEGPEKATTAEITEGTDDSKYVTAKAVNEFVATAMEGDMAAYVNVLSDATSLNFGSSGFYTFNGSQAATWALPALSGNPNVHYFVKNTGSVPLKITGQIYLTSLLTEVDLAAGDAIIIHNDTTNWTIQ